MTVALMQTDIVWGDPKANISRIQNLLQSSADKADLYVLPEMFSTGFNGACEDDPSETLSWLKEMADKYDAAFVGSIALKKFLLDGRPRKYNRFYFVKPGGKVEFYDKKHLFTYAGEDKTFSAGEKRVVVEWRGVRFLLAVCYDLRFPVWLRNRKDYDALICVASWPSSRRYPWDTLLRARAIENQVFVMAVNRVGEDPSNVYNGGSVLLDPYGKPLVSCADSVEEMVLAEMDMSILDNARSSFPVLNDSDADLLSDF